MPNPKPEPACPAARLATRLAETLVISGDDKPDSPKPYPFSPVSPLLPAATTASSSSSSGDLSDDRRNPNPQIPSHRRSSSSSSASSASSAVSPILHGNICPSGQIGPFKPKNPPRKEILGSGTASYGRGTIFRGTDSGGSVSSAPKKGFENLESKELARMGEEYCKKGEFVEGLKCWDKLSTMWPRNGEYRSGRGEALAGMGRVGEGLRECQEAVRIDAGCRRGHYRIGCISLRLGEVENARKHFALSGNPIEPAELHKLQEVERHLERCGDARRIRDWETVLKEADAAISAGADSCSLISASRAEALLNFLHLDEADSVLSKSPKFDISFPTSSASKFFGMSSNCYFNLVQAQVDLALGRFENAVEAAQRAKQLDSRNIEVLTVLSNVVSVASARTQGNNLYESGYYSEACSAYGDGLRYNPANPVLLCNRAACRSMLGQWDKALKDCNEALRIRPKYTKALLRRANSYAKLERWVDAVQDYEVLRTMLPDDNAIAEGLFRAQVSLKVSRGEDISNMKFGGDVEEVTSLVQLQAAVSSGASVVYFMTNSNQPCLQINEFVDSLCSRYPSTNFLKVNINQCPLVAKAENVRAVPTFKIYKNGKRVKEMICPSKQMLEQSLKHYCL